MSLPIDPSRNALPPVAQFLAEAALQRQSALLGLDKPTPAPAPLRTASSRPRLLARLPCIFQLPATKDLRMGKPGG